MTPVGVVALRRALVGRWTSAALNEETSEWDGKGKAPPAGGRIWLAGLSSWSLQSLASAGASRRKLNEINAPAAVGSRLCCARRYDWP
jgi:hypothetical protein